MWSEFTTDHQTKDCFSFSGAWIKKKRSPSICLCPATYHDPCVRTNKKKKMETLSKTNIAMDYFHECVVKLYPTKSAQVLEDLCRENLKVCPFVHSLRSCILEIRPSRFESSPSDATLKVFRSWLSDRFQKQSSRINFMQRLQSSFGIHEDFGRAMPGLDQQNPEFVALYKRMKKEHPIKINSFINYLEIGRAHV